MIRVWDPLVRMVHWALVAAVAIARITAEESVPLHLWAGYTVAGLVALRLVWGFVGSRYARLAQFVPGPSRLGGYVAALVRGREPRYVGHNPAGAVMILALIATLGVTAWTGWLMEGSPLPGGDQAAAMLVSPAFADDDDDREIERREAGPGWAEDLHEASANLLPIALHVAGVVWESLHGHENLVRAMVTGRKRAPDPGDVG